MPEALWVLEAENLGPLIVTMDSWNTSKHQQIKSDAYRMVDEMFLNTAQL